MDFYELVDQVVKLLRQRKRLTYRSLKRQFDLDDEALTDLKAEILYSQPQVVDDEGAGLIWTGDAGDTTVSALRAGHKSQQPAQQQVHTQKEPRPFIPPIADGERRRLSVMFCDLVDATMLSGQLDPEEYREVLRAYQSTCAEVIHQFNGFIAQHLGDALLVYFGYPQTHENEARRAINVGLGMLEAVQTLNQRLEHKKGIRLAIRVGIHTGLTVIGDIGEGAKHEILAIGEAPNIASRIQSVAASDTVAISADTHRLVESYFKVQDLGFHTLKGVAAPMKVYRVLQKRDPQSRLKIASARSLMPLVGREQEIELLLDRWEQVKAGQGQVVLLSGEGGIGKSRLVQEFKEQITDDKHVRFDCRSSPYFQNSALYPVIELWEQVSAAAAAASEKFDSLEQFLGQDVPVIEKIVPSSSALLSPPIAEERYPPLSISPRQQRQKTLETIVAALLKQAEQHPVLFILEDLQWTDPSTIELLILLIDQASTAAFYLLLTCRPTFQPPWGSQKHLSSIDLNRLSRNQIKRMAERVAGGKSLPAVVLQQIVEKTDGVPLFVEETTKAVVESDVLEEQDRHYELTGAFSALAIPATLNDSLMSRLDRLGSAKNIAQLGAVIGRDFSYKVLQAVLKSDEKTLQRELTRLVEAELLYQDGLPPAATYTFKHALIQEAAYQSLLKSSRQLHHRDTARVLETQSADRVASEPELLAHHYTEAGLPERAIDYWLKAGEQAIQRSANIEAISHLNKGLSLFKVLPDTSRLARRELDLQTTLGPALIAVKGYAAKEVETVYERAHKLCQRVGDDPQRYQVLRELGKRIGTD